MKILSQLFKKAYPSTDALGKPPADDLYHLDTPLLYVSPVDIWTIRDACQGTHVTGATGSGKTSGSGEAIAKAFLRQGFGGVILCAKPEERVLWQKYAEATGRQDDLIIFGPDQGLQFNFLDYELRREGKGGGQTENLVALLSHVIEIVEGKVEIGGDGAFWVRAVRELLRNAIDLLSLAKGKLTLEDICQLIADAPESEEDVGLLMSKEEAARIGYEPSERTLKWWRTSFCAECLQEAEDKKNKTSVQEHDFKIALRYWLKTYPKLSDRTRSGIVATFTGMADMLLHGFAWEIFCTDTNIVPEVTYKNRAIIVLDFPIQEYHDLGRIIQGVFKLMFQRAILRRTDKRVPVFLWADEAQNFVSSFDFMVQAVARSAGLCTVYLTQNLSNYYAVLGSGGRDEVNALLGGFQTLIFHANSDQATNQYAADMIAQEWTTAMNFGLSSAERGGSRSGGGSEVVQYKILPGEFATLRKGGPLNDLEVDSIIVQSGRVWKATGETYIRAIFKQRG